MYLHSLALIAALSTSPGVHGAHNGIVLAGFLDRIGEPPSITILEPPRLDNDLRFQIAPPPPPPEIDPPRFYYAPCVIGQDQNCD